MMSGEIHSGVQDVSVINNDSNNNKDDEDDKSSEAIKKVPLCCELCNIKVTSGKILQRHLDGRRHKMRMERRGKCFRCDLCDLTANSETQLNIHLNSSRHKAKLQKKEYSEFTDITTSVKGIWILIFCIVCIFLNLFLLFKLIL
ncbi:zinc finger protein 385B-like [Anoplophora glabripennis]|uniref:zinc finger protein 385B-like n=1 Tax=Anoplophora glabripennis TaxID=217634 RepID=UPI000873B8E0|nr:zinc finger protein 385B-like [Anoplophora glabripennis]